jgi:hypothetical protein
LRNKTPKRRVKAKLRDDRRPATRSNETWAMDFVHDQLATGRKLRVLMIVDTFSRFSPALEPRFTFRGADVVEVLERVGQQVGFRKIIHFGRCRLGFKILESSSVSMLARRFLKAVQSYAETASGHLLRTAAESASRRGKPDRAVFE